MVSQHLCTCINSFAKRPNELRSIRTYVFIFMPNELRSVLTYFHFMNYCIQCVLIIFVLFDVVQVYGGARSDTTHESEYEWSSTSYDGHEVPDIETPEAPELVNEYEMAEMEGAMRLIDAYPERSAEERRHRGSGNGSETEYALKFFHRSNFGDEKEMHPSPKKFDFKRLDNLNTSTVHQRQLPSNFGALSVVQSQREHGENKEDEWRPNQKHIKVDTPLARIKKTKMLSIGGQAAYKPGFFENSNCQDKLNLTAVDPVNATDRLWTQFNDKIKPPEKRLSENEIRNNTADDGYLQDVGLNSRQINGNSRTRIQCAENYRENRREFLGMMAETPRMHQPYTRPHHRNHSNSFWQVFEIIVNVVCGKSFTVLCAK